MAELDSMSDVGKNEISLPNLDANEGFRNISPESGITAADSHQMLENTFNGNMTSPDTMNSGIGDIVRNIDTHANEMKYNEISSQASGSDFTNIRPENGTTFESGHNMLEKAFSGDQNGRDASETNDRPLIDQEKADLKDKTGMSDSSLDRVTINDAGEYKMSCINEGKVGEKSDVPYVEKTVDIDGAKIRVVVPDFGDKAAYECKLPEELCRAPDNKQFEACTNSLKDAIAKNPELANKFTPKQLEMINDGAPRISGYVWHHDAEKGKMQLVPSDVHNANRHTGGKAIWGGGDEMR